MTRHRTRLRAVGIAAVALTAAGLMIPAAAVADTGGATAPTSGPAYEATAKRLMTDDPQVEAVAKDGSGHLVLYTSVDRDDLEGSAKAFVERTSNIIVKNVGEISATAADDVVGGAGYLASDNGPTASLCSVGYAAWSPTGTPAVISAGHCTKDGQYATSYLTTPTGDPAGGGDPNNGTVRVSAPLGTLAFSQYGGAGNSSGNDGDPSSVDISVIDVTNPALHLRPAVTDWTTPNDLSLSTTPVRAVGSARVNVAASKSGRTTGNTSGVVTSVEGWAQVSGRWVYGFAVEASGRIGKEGDSGGAVYQGTTAVGLTSGTNASGTFLWGADLQAGLARTGGYTVALAIDAPVMTKPADGGTVTAGGTISGTAAAGTTVTVTPVGAPPFSLPVGAGGTWSFTAPDAPGVFRFSLRASKGFDTSTTVDTTVNVVDAAPVIVSPADGSRVDQPVSSIAGTGHSGAVVTLGGDASGTATVAADGTWSIPSALGAGRYSITAVQTRSGASSPAATSTFTVSPPVPTISGITDGASFPVATAPSGFAGTGVAGAVLDASLNGTSVGTTTVAADGSWSLVLATPLAAGTYRLVVTQTVNGVSSAASLGFSAVAATAPAGGPTGIPASTRTALALTGASDPVPVASLAALLLLGGAGSIALRHARRRRV